MDTTHQPPKQLGSSAFITSSDAPEYLVAWQAGTRVGVTAIDVDVPASSTETSTAPEALSTAAATTLSTAAVHQNSLY